MPELASAQAPATRQTAGSGSAAVSGPAAGDRRASVTGSEAGTQRASAFSAVQGNAQSVPDNSDASRTRFIFQGPPFGPRASGLGTGKAMSILKTPAAYIGQRAGVSGPERAAFIRELEEGKLGPGAPGGGLVGLGQQQGGGGPVGSRLPLALSPTPPPTLAKSRAAAPVRSRLPLILPRFSRSQTSVGGSGPGPPLRACCCGRPAHFQCPLAGLRQCWGRGAGLRVGPAGCPRSLRWSVAPATGRWAGRGSGFAKAGIKIRLPSQKQPWRWAEPQTDSTSPPPLYSGALKRPRLCLVAQVAPPPVLEKSPSRLAQQVRHE